MVRDIEVQLQIFNMFGNRCVRCNRLAVTIHEIVPKSRRPKTWMEIENRVPLCLECHEYAHSRGAKSSAEELTRLRREKLCLRQ